MEKLGHNAIYLTNKKQKLMQNDKKVFTSL